MSNNIGKEILNHIVEEDIVTAQNTIKQELTDRLASILDNKFSEYASTIFESKKSKKAKKDWDGDGEIESEKDEVWGSRKKAANKKGKWLNEDTYCEDGDCDDMEDSDDVESDEEQSEEEEEGRSHKKGRKKGQTEEEEDEDEEEDE